MNFQITQFESLYGRNAHPLTFTWSELCDYFAEARETVLKDDVPLFGAYALQRLETPCGNPNHLAEGLSPHLCTPCIKTLSAAVFDVDQGTFIEVERCKNKLRAADLATIWYSSFSHSIRPPSMRLIIPFHEPLPVVYWEAVRTMLIKQFSIPADLKTSKDAAHRYYLCSYRRGFTPVVESTDGNMLIPSLEQITYSPPTNPVIYHFEEDNFLPHNATNLRRARETLDDLIDARGTTTSIRTALINVKEGKRIAPDNFRDVNFRNVTYALAYELDWACDDTLMALLQPCIDQTIVEGGSPTTGVKVLSQIQSGRNKAKKRRAEIKGDYTELSRITAKMKGKK